MCAVSDIVKNAVCQTLHTIGNIVCRQPYASNLEIHA